MYVNHECGLLSPRAYGLAFPRHSDTASSHSHRAQLSNPGQFPPSQHLQYPAGQRIAWFVVGSDRILGIVGILFPRKAQPVWEYASKEDWKGQKAKEAGCKLDRVPGCFRAAA